MKNIHILPTDKASRIYFDVVTKELLLQNRINSNPTSFPIETRNIYITNYEEISGFENNIWVILGTRVFLWKNTMALVFSNKPKKIILTTDQDLIADGVQSIPDEFLEFIVKNPSCDSVEVKSFKSYSKNNYIIFIPKEEPKQECKGSFKDCFKPLDECSCDKQETIEEVAERLYPLTDISHLQLNTAIRTGLIRGYNLAQQQNNNLYSEEDMRDYASYILLYDAISPKKWFEKFKKENNINESLPEVIKQVINDEYDDFNNEMQTIFITEVINLKRNNMKQTHLEELRNEDLQHYDTLSFKNYKNSIPRAINFYYDYRQMNLFQRIILAFKKK